MCEATIRCEGGEYLTITVHGRSFPGCTDYWDGNSVRASVELSVGGFRGSVSGELRTNELKAFHQQLVRLQESLEGTAELETMESWLSIKASGDGCGHMSFRCIIRDQPGIGNTLECLLSTDQTFTRPTVAELSTIVKAFPVIGQIGQYL
jgi:hypothetical protein